MEGAEAQSDIVIDRQYLAEPDTFGARLYTRKEPPVDGAPYYRHILVTVQSGGPADQMKIIESDELLLLDEVFVPELTHEDVLRLFSNMDLANGNALLALVIQRKITAKKKWEWIETSAELNLTQTKQIDYKFTQYKSTSSSSKEVEYIQQRRQCSSRYMLQTEIRSSKFTNSCAKRSLQPRMKSNVEKDYTRRTRSLRPRRKSIVEKFSDFLTFIHLKFKELKNNEIEIPKSKHMYKIPGQDLFLDICDGRVFTGPIKGGCSGKIIWKRAKYFLKDHAGHVDYEAALCDITMSWYITVDEQGNIAIQDSPFWFKMLKEGDEILFKINDVYLGYSEDSNEIVQLKLKDSKCLFEELPAPTDQHTNIYSL